MLLPVALATGLAGFLLSTPVHIVDAPIPVSFVFGSVLPLALAMAWGWRAGLVAAVPGLAAMYPFAVWPANGWANPPTALLLCLWFAVHGWAADRRLAGGGRWWHSPYVVELAFDLPFTLYICTAFRWCFTCNPAPWAPAADTSLPLQVALLIACKSVINGLLAVLVADAALHLAPVRRLLRLPDGDERRYDSLIVSLGVTGGLALWAIDALVAGLLSPDAGAPAQSAALDRHLLVSRLLMLAIVLAGSLVVAGFIRRRRRLARELDERIAQHRITLQAALDGFCLVDAEGRLCEVNQAFQVMSGYSAEELVKMRVSDLVAVEQADAVAERIRRITRHGAERFESRHRRKDGSTYEVEVNVQPLAGQGGRFACFVRDISGGRRAMEALELERTLYKDLVSAMPAGVYRCKVTYANPLRRDAWEQRVEISLASDAFCRILGVSRADCERDTAAVVNCIHPGDRDEFTRLNIVGQETLAPFDWEGRIVREGEVRWVRFASLPRRLDDGDVIWTGVLLDTTALKHAEAERQRMEDQLRQREKIDAVGQLAGGIAHDFNNQLTGIQGFAELLELNIRDPEHRSYAASIGQAARRAADLTHQLLAFARKGKYRSVPTDMHAVVREVVALLQRSIDKRIAIVLRPDAAAATVLGDPTQLQNMLLNLGLNARDAMPDGGELAIATRIGDGGSADGKGSRMIEIEVRDTGVGMDADTQRRLFEPFFTTKPVGKGTGLGLASAYGVVKSHGGTISAWSEPGRGSIFTIRLPLHQGAVPAAAMPADAARPDRPGTILVVDDEPVALAAAEGLLQSLGYQVLACGDAAAAIELYRRRHEEISLVILDMVMPAMDGRSLFLALRRIRPEVQAVLTSGHCLDGEAQSIIDAGVKAFIQKPYDRATLALTVESVLPG